MKNAWHFSVLFNFFFFFGGNLTIILEVAFAYIP